MIVEAPAALTLLLLGRRQSAHVTPVIIAKQHRHVIGHTESCIIIVLYFFIQSPYLGRLLGRTLGHLLDDTTLIVDDGLQKLGVSAVAHSLIAVATHTDGHNVISTLHSLDTLPEEAVEIFLIRGIVPSAPPFSVTSIFLMVARHGFVVRGSHHNTHLVGRL